MKIALINENSQAAKNGIIEAALKKVVEPMGHEVVNYGMYAADDKAQLTYVQCGYKEKLSSFQARRAKEGAGVNKRDVQRYLKKQQKEANEPVNNAFAQALSGIKLD